MTERRDDVAPIVAEEVRLDTPVLVVDRDLLQRNIDEMAAFSRSVGVNLRPHIKTHKTPEIARLQIESGAIGIMCAKLAEAEVFAEAGIDDIVIGFQLVGEKKMERLVALLDRCKVTATIDNLTAAEALSRAMTAAGKTIDVYYRSRYRSPPGGRACRSTGLRSCRRGRPATRFTGAGCHDS